MSELRFEFVSVNRGEKSIPDSMGSMCKGPEMSRARLVERIESNSIPVLWRNKGKAQREEEPAE